jgi:hypothetical protein
MSSYNGDKDGSCALIGSGVMVIPAPLRVIGVVRSSRSSLENTPIQA